VAIKRNLLAVAALLPGLAAAADSSMTDLIMPDARVVMEVNVARILASPIGQAMAAQIKTELTAKQAQQSELQKANPAWSQFVGLAGTDWSQYVQEVVVAASGQTKDVPTLLIVRGAMDHARTEVLKAYNGDASEYQGVPILASTGKGNAVIAFLDSSLVVIGQPADVKAAIGRRGHPAGLPAALAEKLKRFSGYDAWMVAAGPFPVPAAKVPPAAAGAPMVETLQRLESFDAGLRFNPDLEVSVEVVAGTVKDASGIAAIMGWLYSAMQSPANGSGKKDAVENGKFEVHGRRILLSLNVPQEKVRAALEQMRAQAASQNKAAGLTVTNPNAPKPGTIRIESSPSDMGTVVLSTGKEQ
jgi:hypothetical protein